MKINHRALQVLKQIIERYIRDGQPVGSKTLAEEHTMALSPATIRNIMAELEEAGYLVSPHTSAGRVPTVQGYRIFVDSLVTVQPLHQQELQRLQQEFESTADTQTLLTKTSNLLSGITQLASVVTIPRRERLLLRQIEFLPLSEKRLLVILVINEYEVQNRIIHTQRNYAASELQQLGNYLTHHYAGKDIQEIQQAILSDMQNDKLSMERTLQDVMDLAKKALAVESKEDYVIAGEANLLSLAEETGVDRLRALFSAFNRKHDILHLLDQCVVAQGMQIFIGEESGYAMFDACSLIAAPYKVNDKVLGVLGVIGPTRMAYDRMISIVDVTAKLLSAAISEPS